MPLKIGDKITLTISDIAFGGEGVGRVDDFVVFVPFVLVGETVDAEITEVKKNFARAKLLRVEKPSPERVEPECRYFGACGGCQYQHVAYPAQLRLKHKQISDLFERVGKIPSDKIAPVIPCPQPYGYRNRIMIRSQWNKPEQKLNIGFIRADCGLVEDIEECKIAEPALNEQILHVRAHPPPKGGIKVVLRVQPENWDVPPDSFFQNNFFLLPKLVETVRGFLRRGGARHLIDLYCGVGFFGIELAGAVESFVGVEYDQLRDQVGAQKRGGAENCQRRIRGGQGRGGFAGAAEEIFAGGNGGDSGPAAQGLPAGNPGMAARNEAGAGHLCVVPSGDDGAGLEHFVRRTVSLTWRACSRWTCSRRRSTWSAWRICARDKALPNRRNMDSTDSTHGDGNAN